MSVPTTDLRCPYDGGQLGSVTFAAKNGINVVSMKCKFCSRVFPLGNNDPVFSSISHGNSGHSGLAATSGSYTNPW